MRQPPNGVVESDFKPVATDCLGHYSKDESENMPHCSKVFKLKKKNRNIPCIYIINYSRGPLSVYNKSGHVRTASSNKSRRCICSVYSHWLRPFSRDIPSGWTLLTVCDVWLWHASSKSDGKRIQHDDSSAHFILCDIFFQISHQDRHNDKHRSHQTETNQCTVNTHRLTSISRQIATNLNSLPFLLWSNIINRELP